MDAFDFQRFFVVIQVGSRPDRRARGMLHVSGGGSEWGVAESGRGGLKVLPTWGNVGLLFFRNYISVSFHFSS